MFALIFVYQSTLFCRYLTNAGIPSERAMRNRQATLIGDNLVGTMELMVQSSRNAIGLDGLRTIQVPCVTVQNLHSMILDYLDRLEM